MYPISLPLILSVIWYPPVNLLQMKKYLVILGVLALAGTTLAADFKGTDKNEDGKISVEEYAGDDKKLQKKFKKLDKDGDGSLNEKEFSKSMKKKKKDAK